LPVKWDISAWNDLSALVILSSVIQGEAADATGQRAVASTMWNRLKSGSFGGTYRDIVVPLQYNGWQSPSAGAIPLAEQLLAGSFVSNTNALYYVSVWYAQNKGWRGTLIGENVFFSTSPFHGNGAPASYEEEAWRSSI
jgi:hypothetical protein